MRSLLTIILSSLAGVIASFAALYVSVCFDSAHLSPVIIAVAFCFVLWLFFPKSISLVLVAFGAILVVWFVAWFTIVPDITEKTPSGAPWYYHHRLEFRAHVAAIGVANIVLLFMLPSKYGNDKKGVK